MPDEAALVAELQRLADDLGHPPTVRELQAHGEYSSSIYRTRFGSWSGALEAAGFDVSRSGHPLDEAELLAELQRLADELGHPPTIQELREHGRYSVTPYKSHFGAWRKALDAAGLDARPQKLTREELLDELQRLADELGHPPTKAAMNEQGAYSPAPYLRVFDSWRDAIEAAGLDPDWNRISKADLIAELERVAAEYEAPPTMATVTEHGAYSVTTYKNRFGSWSEALDAAGFEPVQPPAVADDTLLAHLRDLADELGHPPSIKEMREHGEYGPRTYSDHFDSWTAALEAAGLEARSPPERIPEDDLVAELQRLADDLGETPTKREMNEQGRYHADTYTRRFGSWADALDAAGLDVHPTQRPIPEDDLVAELQRVAAECDGPPTKREMNEQGHHHASTYTRRFGSWAAALKAAGLDTTS